MGLQKGPHSRFCRAVYQVIRAQLRVKLHAGEEGPAHIFTVMRGKRGRKLLRQGRDMLFQTTQAALRVWVP